MVQTKRKKKWMKQNNPKGIDIESSHDNDDGNAVSTKF